MKFLWATITWEYLFVKEHVRRTCMTVHYGDKEIKFYHTEPTYYKNGKEYPEKDQWIEDKYNEFLNWSNFYERNI